MSSFSDSSAATDSDTGITEECRNCRHASRRAVPSARSRSDVGTGRMAGARGSHTCSVLAMHLGCLGVPCGCCVPFVVPLSPVFGITGGTKLGGRSPRSTTRSPACQGCRDFGVLVRQLRRWLRTVGVRGPENLNRAFHPDERRERRITTDLTVRAVLDNIRHAVARQGKVLHQTGDTIASGVVDPHFPYQPCWACRNQQQNYLM